MTTTNRQLILKSRPKGLLAQGDLQLVESPLPELQDGQALAKVKYLSMDPTMRVWMSVDTYLPVVAIGDVMRAFGFAEIIESRNPGYKKGDRVTGLTGLQEYAIIDDVGKRNFQKVPKIPFVSDTVFLGVLGINGLTAFLGMEIAQAKKGETLVVSAAAGATGSIAGQIGKIQGCRVVGIAGSDEKCSWLTKDLGFDAAINYKLSDWKEKLAAATPNGIDIDFENVGGETIFVGRGSTLPGASASKVPPMPTGRMGTPALAAMRARTGLMASSRPLRVRRPSAATAMTPPERSTCSMARTLLESRPWRSTGKAPHCASSQPTPGILNSDALTMVCVSGKGSSTIRTGTSSRLAWLTTTRAGPRGGMFSVPRISR